MATAIQTLTEAVDNLYTTTWQNMKDTLRDQIYDATPFYFWMRDKGKIEHVSGGRFLTEPLRYAKNDSIVWLGKGGTVTLADQEFLTAAKYDWRYQVGTIVRFGIDDQQDRAKNQIMSLMNAKLDNVNDALVDDLETTLAQSTGSVSTGIDGLQACVADNPTTGTYGGINSATYDWWRNKFKDMTGLSFAINGIAEMRTMLNDCGNNLRKDKPDIILSGQTPFEYYEDSVLDFYRVTDNKLADAGFLNQQFKGIPMIWSPAIASTRMYFLNTNFLKLITDPMMEFEMTEWKPIPDQVNDRAAQIISAMQLVCSRRRTQGVLFGIDTA